MAKTCPPVPLARPTATILPSAWKAKSSAMASAPRLATVMNPPVPNDPSSVPLVVYRATTNCEVEPVPLAGVVKPATTMRPSACK